MTNVCHISTMSNWGGVERLLADMLTSVDQRVTKHFLIATSASPEVLRPIKKAGIEVLQPKRRFRYDPGAMLQMVRWLRSKHIQIVHCYNAFANVSGSLAARLAGVPVTITGEHGTAWSTRPPMAWFDQWANRHADLTVAASQASALGTTLRYQVSPQKIRVIYNAVPPLPTADIPAIRASLGIGNALVVGSVGRLAPVKNFSVFIEAAALVSQERDDIRFVLVGGGPQEIELQRVAHRLGIDGSFIFTGWREDARSLVQAFDLFVSTSIHEVFGIALAEAALAGIPVIAPAVGGIPEIVQNGVTGILLHPTRPIEGNDAIPRRILVAEDEQSARSVDPAEVANAILKLADEPCLRAQYGHAGRIQVQERFSLRGYVRKLEEIYLGLLNEEEGNV